MDEIKIVVFWINLILGFLLIIGIVLSIIFPNKRIWPPPSKNSWQYRYVWGLCGLWLVAGVGLCILDWQLASPIQLLRYLSGIILVISGNIFAFWGMKTLSTHQTLGLKGVFTRDGPYRFSRNPQYVGDIFILIGFIILAWSWLVCLSFGLAIIWFAITPFAEEPWLKEQYGEKYTNYTKKISRYFSFR